MQTQKALRIVLPALLLALASLAHAETTLGGYTQLRYNFWDNALDEADSFDFRRVRLAAEGELGNKASFKIQLDFSELDDSGGGSVELKDAYITQPLNDAWALRAGLAKIPFGIEVPESSSKRNPLERSQAARKLFPGEREKGVYFIRAPQGPREPQVSVGITDGMRQWADDDSKDRSYVASLQWKLPNKSAAGASYMRATRTRAAAAANGATGDLDNSVFGVHARWNTQQGIGIQGEFYTGKLLDADVNGYYALVEYQPSATPMTYFYRYDRFDDGNPSHSAYSRSTLGAARELSSDQRLTVQWEDYEDGKGGSYSNVGTQWQFKY